MKRARKLFTRRHGLKWGALAGVLGGGTALLQYIPQSWPTWVGVTLTMLAFAASGVSALIAPEAE